tara:strand:- start:365 stop:667 length:303 start_codon:yes stop_codon:yes gene_type:complete
MNPTAKETTSKVRKHSPPVLQTGDSTIPRQLSYQSFESAKDEMINDLASLNNESIQFKPIPNLKHMALGLRLKRARSLRIKPCKFKIPSDLLRSTFIDSR